MAVLRPFLAVFLAPRSYILEYLLPNHGSDGHFGLLNRSICILVGSKVMRQTTNISVSVFFCDFVKKKTDLCYVFFAFFASFWHLKMTVWAWVSTRESKKQLEMIQKRRFVSCKFLASVIFSTSLEFWKIIISDSRNLLYIQINFGALCLVFSDVWLWTCLGQLRERPTGLSWAPVEQIPHWKN